jgi:GNAT superfamily N-acetyltransferase
MVELVAAELERDRDELIALNVEYLSWVREGVLGAFAVDVAVLAGMPIPDYVAATIDKVIDPRGAFYLLRVDGALAGMGGWRPLEAGVAELKRMYVRTAFRGRRLGQELLARLLDDAAGNGRPAMRLDSAPFMTSAHRLYRAAGFADRGAYAGTEAPEVLHPRWVFMERTPV